MGGVRPSPLSRTLLGLISSSVPLILLCLMLSTPINTSKLKIKQQKESKSKQPETLNAVVFLPWLFSHKRKMSNVKCQIWHDHVYRSGSKFIRLAGGVPSSCLTVKWKWPSKMLSMGAWQQDMGWIPVLELDCFILLENQNQTVAGFCLRTFRCKSNCQEGLWINTMRGYPWCY